MTLVFLTCPGYGFTNTTKFFLKELVDIGNTVYYFSSDKYQSVANDCGCIFVSYDQCFTTHTKEDIKNYDVCYSLKNALNQSIEQWNSQKKVIEKTIDLIAHINPDIIIHDSCMYSGKYIGKLLGIKTVSVYATIPLSDKTKNERYDFLAKNYFNFNPVSNSENTEKSIKRVKQFIEHYLNEIFPIPNYFEIYQSSENLNIVFSPYEIIPYNEDFGKNYLFISQFNYNHIVQNIKSTKQPLVYISFGTSWIPNEKIINYLLKSLDTSKFKVIFSLGDNTFDMRNKTIPNNFVIKSFVNQNEVLQRADLFIGSGGMTSVYEAINFGVPMLLIPFAQADHYILAEQIEKHKCGIKINFNDIYKVDLLSTVSYILKNEYFKKNTIKLCNSLAKPNSIKHAINELIAYANTNEEKNNETIGN